MARGPGLMDKTTPAEELDAYEQYIHREPRRGAGILVIALRSAEGRGGEPIAEGLRGKIRSVARPVESVVVDLAEGWTARVECAVADATMPLILITNAVAPWADAHLKPLLEAIDKADHVIGCRPPSWGGRVKRWLSTRSSRWVFGVPVVDVHSPCRLHRAEALKAIPFQSVSSFLDVEILAKATFLGHLIDEVSVPSLENAVTRVARSDRRRVGRHPSFVRPSTPAEETQGEEEGHDRPDGQDDQRRPDLIDAGPLEDHGA